MPTQMPTPEFPHPTAIYTLGQIFFVYLNFSASSDFA
jgi:hypothetical protein